VAADGRGGGCGGGNSQIAEAVSSIAGSRALEARQRVSGALAGEEVGALPLAVADRSGTCVVRGMSRPTQS
jgi:hypothetical protein